METISTQLIALFRWFRLLLVALWLVLFVMSSFLIAPRIEQETSLRVVNWFEGEVDEYLAPLKFKLDCCDQVLELALVAVIDHTTNNLAQIEQLIRSNKLTCTSMRLETANSGPGNHLVWCNSETGRLLSSKLLELELVVENCKNSGNQFGSCLMEPQK